MKKVGDVLFVRCCINRPIITSNDWGARVKKAKKITGFGRRDGIFLLFACFWKIEEELAGPSAFLN